MDSSTVLEVAHKPVDDTLMATSPHFFQAEPQLKQSKPLARLFPMPVFNFHHVETRLTKPSRKHITISSDGLRRFIRKIRAIGLEPLSLKAAYQNPDAYVGLAKNGRPVRYCLITFDDGLVNNLEHALPVLDAEKCPATIFALPGKYGGSNDWDEGHLPVAERDALLSQAQMKAMAASPYITFGSHGLYHSHLGQLSPDEVRNELMASHQSLSDLLGKAYVPVFAYPWGEYTPMVLDQMAQTPYDYAFTVENGCASAENNPFLLPRYTVFWRDGNPLNLHAKLFRHKLICWRGVLK